jgi:hypothetical protein
MSYSNTRYSLNKDSNRDYGNTSERGKNNSEMVNANTNRSSISFNLKNE